MKLNNIVDLNKTSELTEVVTSFRLHICSILTHFNAFMRVFLNLSFGPYKTILLLQNPLENRV